MMIQLCHTPGVAIEHGGGRAVEAGITTAADQQRRGNIGPYRCLAVKFHEVGVFDVLKV